MIGKIINGLALLANMVAMIWSAYRGDPVWVVAHGMLCLISLGWIIVMTIEEEK